MKPVQPSQVAMNNAQAAQGQALASDTPCEECP